MSAQIKIRLGNLFDGPADLIVLPCSTVGSITSFVADSLRSYNLPSPPTKLELGDIFVQPFARGQDIVQFVAYAASVSQMTSKEGSIRNIGKLLGEFTMKEPNVRALSAPLLGAGAGGLSAEQVVGALRAGFTETASPNAILTICVLHRSVYDRFSKLSHLGAIPRPPLRLFISYTATDDLHTKWVESLGTYLRSEGIEARLDRWHLKRGMDLPQWMTNELQLADRVLIVSNEQYAMKADGRLGGVGWETMIIQGDIATQKLDSHKYLMIVRSEDFALGTPKYLKTKFAFHWHPQDREAVLREELLKELLQISLEPPIGITPVFLN